MLLSVLWGGSFFLYEGCPAGFWFPHDRLDTAHHCSFSLIVWGETQIDSSLASILNATTPIFTVILAHFLTQDERLTVGRSIGVGLGIAGVVVLMGLNNPQHFDWHPLG